MTMMNRMLAVSATLALACLAGCSGHGKSTSEALKASTNKVAGMKSASEYQQAQQAFLSGDLEKALKAVDRSIQINPSVAQSHVLKGRVLLERSDLEGAIESLQRAEAVDPKSVEAQYYLGIVYERFTQPDKALERYAKASELEPSNPQYAVAAAEMMIDTGKFDEAETFLSSRGASFEHNAGVRQTQGHLAMMRGDAKKAATLFNEARLLAPDDTMVLEDLVNAQVATGQFAEAEFNLGRLLKVPANKDRRDLRQMRARCLSNVDRPLEAREVLIELTGSDAGQKDVESWIELGDVCYVLRDMNRLRQASQRIIALAPERYEGYTLKALWQRKQGDLEGALASLDRAVERRGSEIDSLMFKGLVLKELGRTDEASAAFAMVLSEDPSNQAAKQAMESGPVTSAPEGGEQP
jgi:tetratricopeptide (TPR) repeat protein